MPEKRNPFKIIKKESPKAAEESDIASTINNPDGTPILSPNLNVEVNLEYTKYLET